MKRARNGLVVVSMSIVLCQASLGQETPIRLDFFDYEQLDSGTVLITYKFSAKPDGEYEATVFLGMKDGKKDEIRPKSLTGDVRGRISGRMCKIVWSFLKDFPGGVPEGYDLGVRVNQVSDEGWPWYYYAGAGVVLAGAGLAVILSKSDTPPPPPGAEPVIPKPPDR